MKSQLRLVLDQNLGWVLSHELTADPLGLLAQGSGEHHYLFVVRGLSEDFLDVTSHAYASS